MSRIELAVPDLGGFKDVEVIDVLVRPGDLIEVDTPLVTLETEKASLDVPATTAGKIVEVLIKRGDKASAGTLIARIEAQTAQPAVAAPAATPLASPVATPPANAESGGDTVLMPARPGAAGGGQDRTGRPLNQAPGAGRGTRRLYGGVSRR